MSLTLTGEISGETYEEENRTFERVSSCDLNRDRLIDDRSNDDKSLREAMSEWNAIAVGERT